MKKVFYPHVVLLVLGRFLTLFLSLFPICCITYTGWVFISKNDVTFLFITIFLAIMEIGSVYASVHFWSLSWGKLIVNDTKIIWKCLLCKTVTLDISNIKDVSVFSFSEGNSVKLDLYNTGFRYIVLSETNIPYIRVDKIKCRSGIIKFQYSDRLRDILKCKLSSKLAKRL